MYESRGEQILWIKKRSREDVYLSSSKNAKWGCSHKTSQFSRSKRLHSQKRKERLRDDIPAYPCVSVYYQGHCLQRSCRCNVLLHSLSLSRMSAHQQFAHDFFPILSRSPCSLSARPRGHGEGLSTTVRGGSSAAVQSGLDRSWYLQRSGQGEVVTLPAWIECDVSCPAPSTTSCPQVCVHIPSGGEVEVAYTVHGAGETCSR